LEERGIPAVCITALPRLAGSVGASRIVQGVKIPHPCGHADGARDRDVAVRKAIVTAAIETLGREIDQPVVVDPCAAW
jgi:betaine reductase